VLAEAGTGRKPANDRDCSEIETMKKSLAQKARNIVTVKLLDRMVDRHTKQLSRMLGDAIAQGGGKIRMLLAIDSQFPNRGPENLFESLQFVKIHSENIEKIAILGSREGDRTLVGLFSLFAGIEMAYFSRSETNDAIQWLQE
jgi:hypothetical protein